MDVAGYVGDGAAYSQDFVVSSCAQAHFFDAVAEHLSARIAQATVLADLATAHLCVVADNVVLETFDLPFSRAYYVFCLLYTSPSPRD